MSSNMTPSATSTPTTTTKPITKGEIGKLQDLLGAALSKVNPFSSETQDLIENEWDLVKDELLNANVAVLNAILDRKRRSWIEKDGVIYFTVVSDGTTGEQFTKFEQGGKRVGDYAKQLLRSDKFVPTSGVTYNVAVMKGELFSGSNRYTSNIRAEAERRKFSTPPAELACLIRQKFTNEDIEKMGLLWIITFHEPINDSDGIPSLLGTSRHVDYTLSTCWVNPDDGWDRVSGFAFLVPQVSASA